MLGFWRTHLDYQNFVSLQLASLAQVNRATLLEYETEISKLFILDLDPLKNSISSLYSLTGRSSIFQPEIFRSLFLMQHMGFALSNWVSKLEKNFLLRTICSFSDKLPSIATYYDFINRIFNLDERPRLKPKIRKPSKKIGKGKKLPLKRPGIVSRLAHNITVGRRFNSSFTTDFC